MNFVMFLDKLADMIEDLFAYLCQNMLGALINMIWFKR